MIDLSGQEELWLVPSFKTVEMLGILSSRLDMPPSDLTQLCHRDAFSWILM